VLQACIPHIARARVAQVRAADQTLPAAEATPQAPGVSIAPGGAVEMQERSAEYCS